MKTLIIIAAMLSMSCVAHVYRVGRHERVIEIEDTTTKNRHRMAHLAERKARLLGCDKVRYLELTDTFVRILCIEEP